MILSLLRKYVYVKRSPGLLLAKEFRTTPSGMDKSFPSCRCGCPSSPTLPWGCFWVLRLL